MIAACEQHWQGRSQPGLASGVVTKVLQAAGSPPRWGRLYLALTLVDPDDAEDVAHLPSLVQAAWQAKGYHLRLKALDTAAQVGRRLDDQVRARLVDVLASFDVSGNIMLSTILVEALAACDAIEPMSTLDQIRAEIDAVLAAAGQPRSVVMPRPASTTSQFEQEDIVGPYFEAVAELDDRRKLQLCVMAARAELSVDCRRQARLGAPGDRRPGRTDRRRRPGGAARGGNHRRGQPRMPQEAVQAHLEGLRGWARIAEAAAGSWRQRW